MWACDRPRPPHKELSEITYKGDEGMDHLIVFWFASVLFSGLVFHCCYVVRTLPKVRL